MARISRIVFAGLLALAGASAHAGYAQLAPPPGFAPMPTASPARWGYAKAANEAWVNQTVRVNPSLNVGGQTIRVPASMKLAANAPRFAAAAVFASPHLRLALGVASWLAAAKFIWDESSQSWRKLDSLGAGSGPDTDGHLYIVSILNNRPGWDTWHKSKDAACSAGVAYKNSTQNTSSVSYNVYRLVQISNLTCEHSRDYYSSGRFQFSTNESFGLFSKVDSSPDDCPINTTKTDAGCLSPAISQPDFVEKIASPTNPMPSTVPDELPPGTPLPVEQPVINPSPGTNPQPQPYFVPQGNPVPNPNYDPNAAPSPQNKACIIPGVRIVPSPTADEPWRVDVQPVNRPTPTKDPLTPDELNPQPDPNADPNTQPDPGAGDNPKPEEQQSLCEKHPEILACQKLDEVQPTELAKEDININISPVAGWGSDSAACPAPRAVVVAGKSVEISWQPVCDFASGLRPLVIALAWLSAVSMVIVVARRN